MKKYIAFTAFCIIGLTSFGQTTVFEKNKEIAQYKETKEISKIVSHEFVSTSDVTTAQYNELVSILSGKDGYVSCTLTGKKIIITHENWIPSKDVLDVISSATIVSNPVVILTEGEIR